MFWILLGLYLVMMVLALVAFSGLAMDMFDNAPIPPGMKSVGYIRQFPAVWNFLTYFASFFHVVLGIIIIITTCNEYGYKTVRQNVISGMSRWEFLVSKFLMFLVYAVVATAVVGISIIIIGLFYSDPDDFGKMFDKIAFLPAFFLQLMGYSMFAFLVGLLLRRTGFAIGFYFIYVFAVEKILVFYIPEPVCWYMPIEAMDNMIVLPFAGIIGVDVPDQPPLQEILLTLGYTLGFGWLSYYVLKRRDI